MAEYIQLLSSVAIKSIPILGLGLLLQALLRRRSAALRHFVGVLAMSTLLFLPLFAVVLPSWRVSAPETTFAVAFVRTLLGGSTSPEEPRRQPAPGSADALPGVGSSEQPMAPSDLAVPSAERFGTSTRHTWPGRQNTSLEWGWATWVLLVYLTGAGVALAQLLAGHIALARLVYSGRMIESGPWHQALEKVTLQLDEEAAKPPPQLIECAELAVPITCGVLRPKILIPSGSELWPPREKTIILAHELAHVRRFDCLTQLLVELAKAIYWFNPLAWWLAARTVLERERACDDLVLTNAAARPAEYSEALLAFVRRLKANPASLPQGAITMASQQQLDPRIKSILDAKADRKTVRPGLAAAVGVLFLACAVPLAMVQAGEDPPAAPRPEPLDPFEVELPSGVRVALVGVGDASADNGGWWTPEGETLQSAPYRPSDLADRQPLPGQKYIARALAARINGLPTEPDDAVVSWRFTGMKNIALTQEEARQLPKGFSLGTSLGTSGKAQRIRGVWAGAFSIPATNESATLILRFAAGDWRDAQQFGFTLPDDIPQAHGSSESSDAAVGFEIINEKEAGLRITAIHDLASRDQQARIIVIDKEGKRHIPQSAEVSPLGIRDVQQVVSRFPQLTPGAVKSVVLQGRPWQHVRFRNISLKEGHKTQVQSEVVDLRAERKAEAEAKANPPKPQPVDAFAHVIDYKLGDIEFYGGDSIQIDEIRGTKPGFERGATYLINGRYTLASKGEAKLSVFVAATKPGEAVSLIRPGQSIVVQRGSGTFCLATTLEKTQGLPHVSFYPLPSGGAFGAIYFGQDGSPFTPARYKSWTYRKAAGAPEPTPPKNDRTFAPGEPVQLNNAPQGTKGIAPVVVSTIPTAGSEDVDPYLTEITVTYSKAMNTTGWSWSADPSLGPFPEKAGEPRFLEDGRTCVLPVKLQPGTIYVLRLNSEQHHGFKDVDDRSAEPYLLTFRTRD